jgi:REP element-mobilizing transposase RayT
MHVYAINGWYDHVHLVTTIPPQLAVAHAVKPAKGVSSHHARGERVFQRNDNPWGAVTRPLPSGVCGSGVRRLEGTADD